MKKTLVALAVLALVFAAAMPTLAKNNTISVTGSYGSTIVGLEYERRIGNFGVGLEVSMLSNPRFWNAPEPGQLEGWFDMRINGLFRYYLNLNPTVRPYISLAPGVYLGIPIMDGEQPEPYGMALPNDYAPPVFAAFDLITSAGIELNPGPLRIAAEAGYEFIVYPYLDGFAAQPLPLVGSFFFKGAVGVRF